MIAHQVASDEEKGEGSCVLVELSLDANGRELLDWALGKVARGGDRVVAVHVCRSSELWNSTAVSLIRVLDDFLTVYEGLCNLKKVVLVGRVSPGDSIRKVLVKEAKLCSAMTVVVGVNKNYLFGCSASLAKYYTKKLPASTTLIAIHNGKVMFEREATKPPSGGEPKPTLRSVLHPNVGMDPKVIVPKREFKLDTATPGISDVGYGGGSKEEGSEDPSFLVHPKMTDTNPSSISVPVRRFPEQNVGWPLLRRAVSANIAAPKNQAQKISVVQWVMKLPNRALPSNQPHMELIKELKVIIGANTSSCQWFPYKELRNSTDQFSSENLIGKGGNSQVYKGCLPDGQLVAIKLSKLTAETSRDFLFEIGVITKLQHKHVVPLMGICVEDNHLISVYNYFSKGSLEENLHGKRVEAPLPWDTRFKVAVGVAEALSYLHSGGCSEPVIHRDVKSSNILLNDKFESQLSDFGLATWAPTSSAYVTHSDVVGTFGYLAPEYFMYGKFSEKVDVYAFGVVLLELLSGRKPISDDNPKGQESLVMWATPILEKGDVSNLLDPNLEAKHDEDQVRVMILAASLCIRRSACQRPQMSQILNLLQGADGEAWMNCHTDATLNELDCQDEETYPASSIIGSHLGLALLDVEDDASVTSFEQSQLGSLEEYLRERWSRSSSFD